GAGGYGGSVESSLGAGGYGGSVESSLGAGGYGGSVESSLGAGGYGGDGSMGASLGADGYGGSVGSSLGADDGGGDGSVGAGLGSAAGVADTGAGVAGAGAISGAGVAAMVSGLQGESLSSSVGSLVLTNAAHSADCEIGGGVASPGVYTYTVRAFNDGGQDEVAVRLTVLPAAPVLAILAAQTVYAGQAGLLLTLANGGGAPDTCTLHFAPAGLVATLSTDNTTCVIVGTVAVAAVAGLYDATVTAVNDGGTSVASAPITVRAPAAPVLLAPTGLVLTQGLAVTAPIVVTNTAIDLGAAVAAGSCAFTDELVPSTATPVKRSSSGGFSISTDTLGNACHITGAADDPGTATLYVCATAVEGGLDITELTLSVNPVAPLLTAPAPQTVVAGDDIVLTLINAGGVPQECTTASTLPDGLTVALDITQQTCQLSGTVDRDAGIQMYNVAVQASNAGGDSTAVAQITVAMAAPVLPTPSAISVSEDESITALTLTSSAGRPDRCVFINLGAEEGMMEVSNHHGLSAEVSVSGVGCTVTGAPFGEPGEVTYTLRAINDAGFGEVTITITITDTAPVFGVATEAITITAGQNFDPITLITTGSAPQSCFFADSENSEIAVPDRLVVTTATPLRGCILSGSVPDVGQYVYFLRAANSAGGDNVSVAITVVPVAPNLPMGPLSFVATDGREIDSVHITNTGGDISAVTIATEFDDQGQPVNEMELPGCLFLELVDGTLLPIADQSTLALTLTPAPDSCTLSGILIGAGTHSFIVGAQNAAGNDSVVVEFTVVPHPPSLGAESLRYTALSGQAIEPVVIANSGGDIVDDGCQFLDESLNIIADGTLPLTLLTAADSCTLNGVLSGVSTKDFIVSAYNIAGRDNVVVTFTVGAAAPDLVDVAEDIAAVVDETVGADGPVVVVNMGGLAVSCAFVDPADPMRNTLVSALNGLNVVVAANGSDCAIYGALSQTGRHDFTVRATNANGSADAQVVFVVYAANWTVLSADGIAAPNVLSVLTSASGQFSTDADETTGPMASTKMTWTLNANTGELQVTINDTPGAAALLTRLNPAIDLNAYAEGEIAFDINVPDYTAISAMILRLDCTNCPTVEHALGTPGSTGWETVRLPISTLVAAGLNLSRVSTGIVIYPNLTDQNGNRFNFRLRNIRWIAKATQ
ncbi:MAG: hypothetical protein K0U66_07285, partial [Gammaproteobacteria bacterium]|nr:hypothetical protein [Gammaproteobacteria bacterium]